MSRRAIISSVLAAVLIAGYVLWPTDESRIKRVFSDGARAVEERKTEDIMAKISFNYSDDQGLSYIVLRQILEKVLGQAKNISVEYEIKKIDIKEAAATADLDVRVIATYGKDTGYFIGDAARPEHMTFSLEKVRTKWLINKVRGLPGRL